MRSREHGSLREHGYTRHARRHRQDVRDPERRSLLEGDEIADLDRRRRMADADVVERDGVPDDNADSELVREWNGGIRVGLSASGRMGQSYGAVENVTRASSAGRNSG